jgi:WD40 repeat protein
VGSEHQQDLVQSIDFSNGNKVTTLSTLPNNSSIGQISSDGKIALVNQAPPGSKSPLTLSIWDITSGKKISDLPSTISNSIAAFSPDGSQVAVSVPGALQIYTTANGHLLASIADTSSATQVHILAWSPNGKYLAESANAIKIYNVGARKLATTFGAVDAQHRVVNLAWAPDNTGIASTTMVLTGDGVPANTRTIVNVWKLG